LQKSCTFYNLQVQKKKREMNSSLSLVSLCPLSALMVREKLYCQTTSDHGDDIEVAELSSSENPALKA
jgi:paraquat-inducible protein B